MQTNPDDFLLCVCVGKMKMAVNSVGCVPLAVERFSIFYFNFNFLSPLKRILILQRFLKLKASGRSSRTALFSRTRPLLNCLGFGMSRERPKCQIYSILGNLINWSSHVQIGSMLSG